MNIETLPPPTDSPSGPAAQPAENLAHRLMNEAESLAHRDPATVVAAALGAGLMLNLVPKRFIVGSVTAITVTLLRPALITLGIIKAFELCSIKNHNTTQP